MPSLLQQFMDPTKDGDCINCTKYGDNCFTHHPEKRPPQEERRDQNKALFREAFERVRALEAHLNIEYKKEEGKSIWSEMFDRLRALEDKCGLKPEKESKKRKTSASR